MNSRTGAVHATIVWPGYGRAGMSSLLFVLALLDWVGLLQFFIPDHFLYFSISVPAIFSNKPIGSWLPSANGGWQNQALVQ